MPAHVLDDVLLPVMTLRESALAANAAVMQAYVDRHGLLFAPHMKTHMAPALARRQLDLGAWGMTVASVQQAVVAWDHGIRRLFIANEVLDPAGLAWIAGRPGAAPDADVLFQVDSDAGVAAAAEHGALDVLVEIGFPGGRTGVRSPADGIALAHHAAAAGLRVRGVTGYEGGLPGPDEARSYVRGVLDAASAVREVVAAPRTLLSMGGSAWFDAVVDAVEDRPDDVDVLLRSGASLTHDDGFYAERTPFGRRPEEGHLRPAIRVWGRVTSCPEPGLALVAVGKRDISFDEGLPVVREVRPGGTASARPVPPVPGTVTVTRLDDQHCYLRLADGAPALTPGDVVVFGISHPCTVFDKWRRVLVLDDDDRVLDTIETVFR
ncbi:alanine racemase [Curtobacterium sp. 'Ferrero']|uniref:alanine racemase n=1 Tax=Curtobacterium sp. 'Ferrero' TaxID=2033654 RepID=UPI000BCE373D|nr:alanine racemase [Curtobacterium sp. 'Ferrero']PCN49067.1 alanine racemase [Curtobacterium sp. 'Ferrero']